MADEQLSDPQVNEAGVSRAQQPETVTTALEDSDAALSTSSAASEAPEESKQQLNNEPLYARKLTQYSRGELLAFKDKPALKFPPGDWDVQQFIELYQPAVKEGQRAPPGFGPASAGPDYSGQHRKDSWRGKPSNSREGPIRSRLVHDGFLNDADAHLNARQGGGQQQDNTEQQARAAGPASTSARPARTVGRKDSDAPDWWANGPTPNGDTWRGAGPGRGHGSGPTGTPGPGEKQWMGRGGPAAGPVDVPAGAPGKTSEREPTAARSVEADWRSNKRDGPIPSPSSREWGNAQRNQPQDRDLKRPPGFPDPQDRHRSSSRNPEWMADSSNAGKDDADGLTAGARRAKDFEAERQRMKEEWKREQAHKTGAAKPAPSSEFMSDRDLEQLKADSNVDKGDAVRSKSNASEQTQPPPGLSLPPTQRAASINSLPHIPSQELQLRLDSPTTGSVSAAQAFSFNSLAQAAGLGLPQMRPVPRGAAKLEEIERRQSGSLEVTQLSNASASQTDSHTKLAATPAPPVMARAESAPAAKVSAAPSTESPFAALAPDQPHQPAETGKALLNMLASTSAASSRAVSVTPPPGFAASKAPSAISWGSANHLQGIWGAPTSTPGLTGQPDWGPPPAADPGPLSAAFARSVSPATSQLLPQQQMMQQHVQQEASAPHIDQRLLFPLQGASAPFPTNPAAPFTGQLDQLSRAQQAQQALAALSNRDASAASVLQQDSSGNRAVDASQNPLLALLGRHNASATQGHRGEQDAQLQAFLQAQTSHYSWHPPTPAPAQQMRPAMMQPRPNYLPQQMAPAANAALSQDLLRQLQLGQNARHNAAAAYNPPPQQAGLHAYHQPAAHLQQQSRLPPQYGGQLPYAHVQAAPQYPQQQQLPFNLGNALSHQGYGAQHQSLQNLGLPGHGLSSLGHAAASHIPLGSPAYSNHRQHSVGNQIPDSYRHSDYVTQLQLQRLQSQQHSYAQPQQQSIDINKMFAPRAFGHAPATNMSAIPNMQLSLQEIEAMMARQ